MNSDSIRYKNFAHLRTLGMPMATFRRGWRFCECGNGLRRRNIEYPVHCEACGESLDDRTYDRILESLRLAYHSLIPGSHAPFVENMHVDHIVPRWYGKKFRVDVYELASVDNIQFLSAEDNAGTGRYTKGSLLPEDWLCMITRVEWIFGVVGDLDDFKSLSLEEICRRHKLSYVKAASQLIKQGAYEMWVGGMCILREHPDNFPLDVVRRLSQRHQLYTEQRKNQPKA